jgi:hypothetical protein
VKARGVKFGDPEIGKGNRAVAAAYTETLREALTSAPFRSDDARDCEGAQRSRLEAA